MNLNGGISSPSTSATASQLLSSPTTPKLCNLPSLIPPLTPTPVNLDKNINKNESVTVTHFSDLHGGVVEKISVPVTTALENGSRKSPTMEFAMARASKNPFAEEILTTTIISTSTTTTSPTIKISTNPFLRNSFNSNEKSVKISFAIGGGNTSNGSNGVNPFDISDASDEMNGAAHEDANGNDDVDNENNLSSISSVNLKIDANNEINITKIQTDTLPSDGQKNGTKKVCWSFTVESHSLTYVYLVGGTLIICRVCENNVA